MSRPPTHPQSPPRSTYHKCFEATTRPSLSTFTPPVSFLLLLLSSPPPPSRFHHRDGCAPFALTSLFSLASVLSSSPLLPVSSFLPPVSSQVCRLRRRAKICTGSRLLILSFSLSCSLLCCCYGMTDGETDQLVVYFQPGVSADCAAAVLVVVRLC